MNPAANDGRWPDGSQEVAPMGVHATYCLVCGLPVQHDHYVATERENVWAIYRDGHRPEGHFPFAPEHDWLQMGLAINKDEGPILGHCEDGCLIGEDGEEYYVGDGGEDYNAMHAYCWNAAGRPREYNAISHFKYAYSTTFLEKYRQQLFDFAKCQADGDGWLLLNPNLPEGERNRARIAKILTIPAPVESKKTPGTQQHPETVEELLASDDWLFKYRPYEQDKYDIWRFRNNVTREIDKSGYPHLFWVTFKAGDTPVADIERFERELFERTQSAGLAVALAMLTVKQTYYFALYAKDPEACKVLVSELCPVEDYEIQQDDDPDWEAYYGEIFESIVALRGY